MAVFVWPNTGFKSDGDQLEFTYRIIGGYLEYLQKGVTALLEVSHYHLLVTPPSHNPLRRLEVRLGYFGE